MTRSHSSTVHPRAERSAQTPRRATRRLRALLASCALASLLYGCGGGGSSDTPAPSTTASSISTQPQDLSVTLGSEAVFSVTATGSPVPSVQWERSADAGASWSAIGSATGTSYRFTPQLADDGLRFRARATNTANTATSNAAVLRVLAADTVSTRFGAVKGNSYSGGHEFLGIPFAKPPVGALRWKPPVDPVAWTSVLATQAFRPACPQKNFSQGSSTSTLAGDEDCLQLNLWTPATATPSLPVLVFIHGGGQQQGSASEMQAGTQIYNGRNMAARGPAVVVTLQYRLGPLGYLVHPGLEPENASHSSGNYGVMDQIQALKWVHDNIAAFGGDPTRVMVFGQSAGGVNVGNLLTSALAQGLFQRAGIESAEPLLSPYADAKTKGIDFVNGLAATGTDVEKIAALRATDWHSIIDTETAPVSGGIVQMNWQAVIDGVVFKTDPDSAFSSGQFNHVPLLIGSNADEMSLSAPAVVQPAMVTALVAASVPAQYRAQALQLYPPGSTPDEAKVSYVQILTDAQFTSTVRRAARGARGRAAAGRAGLALLLLAQTCGAAAEHRLVPRDRAVLCVQQLGERTVCPGRVLHGRRCGGASADAPVLGQLCAHRQPQRQQPGGLAAVCQQPRLLPGNHRHPERRPVRPAHREVRFLGPDLGPEMSR